MPKQKTPKLVTRESLQQMLENDNQKYVQAVVGRALVAIFKRQTESEQSSNDTREWNAIGFSGADAFSGSLTAKYWMKHKRLEDWMLEKWLRKGTSGYARLCKYHKQLNEIATERS